MEQLYTVKEVAEILKVTTKTVYSYMNEGKLKSLKLGGSRRIKKSELTKFIERVV